MSPPTNWRSSSLCCRRLSLRVYWSFLNILRFPSTVSPGFRASRFDRSLSSVHLSIWPPSRSSYDVPPSTEISIPSIISPVHSPRTFAMEIHMPSCPSWSTIFPPTLCGTILPATITPMPRWFRNLAPAPIWSSVSPAQSSPHGSPSWTTHRPRLILLSFWDEPRVATPFFLLPSHLWSNPKKILYTMHPKFPNPTWSPWESWLWVIKNL